MSASSRSVARGTVVITGGAGFIGSNLAHALARQGWRVALVDNLSRPGVEQNVAWLRATHGSQVSLSLVDVRDGGAVQRCIAHLAATSYGAIAGVFHLAAQVAVTSSLCDPMLDFQVNALGTVHILEALRALQLQPPFIFTSTNKVYGCLHGLPTRRIGNRYEPEDAALAGQGIDERQPLDFQSPYGCSKGTADQYVLEYARTYGLPAAVFRMSCIYGPHQFGTEDQGWIAHFLIRALEGRPITLYGDGCQVRDGLYVDDLVRAFQLAHAALRREAQNAARGAAGTRDDGSTMLSGQAFNIGGGPDRVISLIELIRHIGMLHGREPQVQQGAWRLGDQRYYVSNTQRFSQATGWQPEVGLKEGIALLFAWLMERRSPQALRASTAFMTDQPARGEHLQHGRLDPTGDVVPAPKVTTVSSGRSPI